MVNYLKVQKYGAPTKRHEKVYVAGVKKTVEMNPMDERRISTLIVVGIVVIIVAVGWGAVLYLKPLERGPSGEENQEEPSQDNEQQAPLTGVYTNEKFLMSLENEKQEFKEQYMPTIYPAPKPLPEKFNCVWVALPSKLKDTLERIDELKAMGFNSIHFGPPILRDENNHPYAVGLDLVKFYINEFHREGMHVILTTNPAGPWFGSPNEGDAAFMDEYSQVIYELAEIAEEFNVAAFIPANEYQLLAQSHDIIRDMPQELLPEIRKRYDGAIGFSIQGRLDYELEGYDFILMMGRTACVEDTETRNLALDHHAEVTRDDLAFMRDLADADLWFGFLMFSGTGNYWEPNNDNPVMAVTPDEAAQYANIILETAYENLSCVMPGYDTGFYLFEDPLPQTWQKHFSLYSQPEQAPPSWSKGDLDIIHEILFPEWDGIYTKPWNPRMVPGYWTEITSTDKITISGLARCTYPDYINVTNFTFQGDGRDIEIRLADNQTGELLVNAARLMNIENRTYDNATLILHYPDYLESHMFNQLIIYDADNREVLGQYEFSSEE